MVRTKSSPFYGSALFVGALMGGASMKSAHRIQELGHIYGEMIQIHDDLGDTMAKPAGPDWIQRRFPLPILFATFVDHPDKTKFEKLRTEISSPEKLEEAQNILISCGAVSYCLDQLIKRYQAGKKLLSNIKLSDSAILNKLLDEVVYPVSEFSKAIGEPMPDEIQLEFI